MSGEVQKYVLSTLRAYWEHVGASMQHVRSEVDYEGMEEVKEYVVQIGHPKEGVNTVNDGYEHQA